MPEGTIASILYLYCLDSGTLHPMSPQRVTKLHTFPSQAKTIHSAKARKLLAIQNKGIVQLIKKRSNIWSLVCPRKWQTLVDFEGDMRCNWPLVISILLKVEYIT